MRRGRCATTARRPTRPATPPPRPRAPPSSRRLRTSWQGRVRDLENELIEVNQDLTRARAKARTRPSPEEETSTDPEPEAPGDDVEAQLAAQTATVHGLREKLHLAEAQAKAREAELLERIAQLEAQAPRAEVAPVARPPPARIHPELADRARRWASRLGVRLSEYDLEALVQQMA